MNESRLSRHPLFDPASRYSRMRKSVRPEYKMRGYFFWQKARAMRLGLPLPDPELRCEELDHRNLRYLTWDLAKKSYGVNALVALQDGRLASGGYDGTVRVWDLETKQATVLLEHGSPVYALAVLPNGRLASGSNDGTVRLWDLRTKQASVLQGHEDDVDAWQALEVIKRAAGIEPTILQGHEGPVCALAVLPDGRLASGSNDGTVRIWDLETKQAAILLEHGSPVKALAVLPDGRLAFVGSIDHTVHLWDLETKQAHILQGHRFSVEALAVLPDGRLASGGWDDTVRVWDLSTHESLALQGHDVSVGALAVLPDGHLASASHDGTVRVWDLASGTNCIVGEHGPDFRVTDAVDIGPVICLYPASWCEMREGRLFPPLERWDRALALVREADGTQSVGMGGHAFRGMMWELGMERDPWQPVACRAFLIEPEVLARLQEIVKKAFEVDPDEALAHAFAAETVAGNLDIARLLSSIPDLDGELRFDRMHFQRVPVASEFATFPPRQGELTVVLVFDHPAAPGPPALCQETEGVGPTS